MQPKIGHSVVRRSLEFDARSGKKENPVTTTGHFPQFERVRDVTVSPRWMAFVHSYRAQRRHLVHQTRIVFQYIKGRPEPLTG
jgi:hypothetical protein